MSRVRGSMVRTVGVAVFVGIAWSASTVAAQAAPAVVDVSSAFTPRQVNPSGPLDPRCILAQGNPICANGPWVADPNATPNPLPKGPAGGDLAHAGGEALDARHVGFRAFRGDASRHGVDGLLRPAADGGAPQRLEHDADPLLVEGDPVQFLDAAEPGEEVAGLGDGAARHQHLDRRVDDGQQ